MAGQCTGGGGGTAQGQLSLWNPGALQPAPSSRRLSRLSIPPSLTPRSPVPPMALRRNQAGGGVYCWSVPWDHGHHTLSVFWGRGCLQSTRRTRTLVANCTWPKTGTPKLWYRRPPTMGPRVRVKGCTEAQRPSMVPKGWGRGGGKSGSARSLGATTLATHSLDSAKASPTPPSSHPAFTPPALSTQTCGSAGFRPPSWAGAARHFSDVGLSLRPAPESSPAQEEPGSGATGRGPGPALLGLPGRQHPSGLGTGEGGLGAGVPGRLTPPGSPPQPPPPSYGRESAPHRAGEGPPTCLSAPTSQAHLAACIPGYLTPLSLHTPAGLCALCGCVCGIVNRTCAQRVPGSWG